ncbi:hypothetical protein KSS87_008162 [Heliosperma pusillum]|nr:hypothetical protein KSS87_008162 [Heliosperma pusillum]
MFHFLMIFVPLVLGRAFQFFTIFLPRVLGCISSYPVRLNHQITRIYPFSR